MSAPLQGYDIGDKHLVDNVDRHYRCVGEREKLVIGGAVFALKDRGSPTAATAASAPMSSTWIWIWLSIQTNTLNHPDTLFFFME